MIRLSGAALFGVSLSIPSPQLQSPLHVIFSAPSSHPHPALTLPVSGRYSLADEMMSHMFDVYCLYLGGGCQGNTELTKHYYPLFKLLDWDLHTHTTHCFSFNSILNGLLNINDTFLCVLHTSVCGFCLYDCDY